MSVRDIADAAGIAGEASFVAVPENVLGNLNLKDLLERTWDDGALIQAETLHESLQSVPPGQVRVVTRWSHPVAIMSCPGWLYALETHRDALELTKAVLNGDLEDETSPGTGWDVLVHAARVAPGVWVSRNASVRPSAKLVAPVLIGPGAMVRSNAVVGPGTVLGDHSVVQRDAVVRDSIVAPGTIIGEGVQVETALVEPGGLTDLDTGNYVRVDDSLRLGRRRRLPIPRFLGAAR